MRQTCWGTFYYKDYYCGADVTAVFKAIEPEFIKMGFVINEGKTKYKLSLKRDIHS